MSADRQTNDRRVAELDKLLGFSIDTTNQVLGIAEQLQVALSEAVKVIEDYLAYEHDGDPWREDARVMGEMDINDYGQDGRLAHAKALLEGWTGAR